MKVSIIKENMKSLTKVIIILWALINLSCYNNSQQIIEKQKSINSVEVQDTVTVGVPFEIEIEISVSGCDTYSRFELEETEEDLFLKVFINKYPYKTCLTGIFIEKIKEEIKIETLGEKKLIINDSTIVKTIQVNQ